MVLLVVSLVNADNDQKLEVNDQNLKVIIVLLKYLWRKE
ncbi:hypothetical protein SAMN05443549_105172 [Flavobacterium fluvii]|uniref:Uncharacterized protein n=1 Tax=Flavobacterium fluvii TaxID=468056 RepID=A0A1M5LE67_9FLAO|nr:hypothetical protein SAMN05443549_105172 [Flavobacterium fluvii]